MPSPEEARQFCIMLSAGLPAEQAILYFTDSQDPGEVQLFLAKWLRSREVAKQQVLLDGKSWQDMTLDEQISNALKQHYAGLAYMLRSTHYMTAQPNEKAKLDSARTALEQKQAGTSGKSTPLELFYDDLRAGRIPGLQKRAAVI